MKKLFCILSCLLAAGCTSFEGNPYGDTLRSLSVQVVYPEEYASFLREGVPVKLTDRNSSNVYTALTDARGVAAFDVAAGHYRLSVLDRPDASSVFNGAVEQVDLAGADRNVSVELKYAKPGTILIKEIYSGGCPQDPPATGSYADDKYIVLHNNSFDTYYLDGLCLGMVAPYNSNANNPWTSTDPSGNIVFRDYAAMPDCIWMFPGTGTDFPLEPGEEAVVAYYGVDHTQTYSQSVNLNRKGYFVLYDMVHYPGNRLHPTPTPGDQIDESHYMKVLKKNRNEYGRGLCDIAEFACRDPFPGARRFRSGRLSGQRSRIGDRQRQRRLFENSVGVDRRRRRGLQPVGSDQKQASAYRCGRRIRRILGQGAGTQPLPQAGRRGHCERRIRPICGYQ